MTDNHYYCAECEVAYPDRDCLENTREQRFCPLCVEPMTEVTLAHRGGVDHAQVAEYLGGF